MARKRAKALGRPRTADGNTLLQLTVPLEVDNALERLRLAGVYGRSKSEVVVTLLSREFEKIARDQLLPRLATLSGLRKRAPKP